MNTQEETSMDVDIAGNMIYVQRAVPQDGSIPEQRPILCEGDLWLDSDNHPYIFESGQWVAAVWD